MYFNWRAVEDSKTDMKKTVSFPVSVQLLSTPSRDWWWCSKCIWMGVEMEIKCWWRVKGVGNGFQISSSDAFDHVFKLFVSDKWESWDTGQRDNTQYEEWQKVWSTKLPPSEEHWKQNDHCIWVMRFTEEQDFSNYQKVSSCVEIFKNWK